jgi:hypothetical protein
MTISSGAKIYASEYGVSIRENLLDVISNISPTETLFLRNFKRESTPTLMFECLSDTTTSDFDGTNAHVDGEEYEFSTPGDRTRFVNWCQYFTNTYKVGKLINRADQAGLESELAYQKGKAGKKHGLDIESAIIYSTLVSGTASGTASKTRGIDSWIETHSATGSASGAFTETAFNDLCEEIVTQGDAAPNWVVLSPKLKRQASSFTTPNTRNIDAAGKRLIADVRVYDGDFGIFELEYCIWLSASNSPSDNYGRAYFIDRSKWDLRVYMPTTDEPVYLPAAAVAGVWETTLGVKCIAEAANGKYLASNS